MTRHEQQQQHQHQHHHHRAQQQPRRRRGAKNHVALNMLAMAATATAASLAVAPPPAAHATIRINEVFIDAPGTNNTQDFIELISTTPSEAFDLHMLLLEGDAGAAGGTGVIDQIIPLTGATGTNGLFLRDSFRNPTTLESITPSPAPAPETVRQTGVFNATNHENLAISWVLVSGFTGAQGQDLDTNDDGVIDVTPWTSVVDAIGVTDGGPSDKVYGAALGFADFNENAMGAVPGTIFLDTSGARHGVNVTGAVGGPYTVNAGFTVEPGYTLSPGNLNNAVAAPSRAWIGGPAGASWNTAANWSGGIAPAAAGDIAMFDGHHGVGSGASTITLDADATVAVLSFQGGDHTIAPPGGGGGGTLTLDTVTGNAQVLTHAGNPAIDVPLVMQENTNFRIGRPSSLRLKNLNANGFLLTKQGLGVMTIESGFTASGLTITSGGVKIQSDGSFNRVVNAAAVTMSGTTSRIDLMDNKLVTNTPAGTASGGIYSGVQGMVQKAYNFGAWDGQGVALLTSMPEAGAGGGPLAFTTTLAVATAEQVLFIAPTDTATWAGQTVTGATTLVMYTYAGDANFDGLVDGADYGTIDNYVQFPGTDGYANGDFNYDGVIDGADYGIIDNTVQLQGTPIPSGNSPGGAAGAFAATVSAVPEPTGAAGLALLSAALLARRGRRGK